jgi:hypothetical protein
MDSVEFREHPRRLWFHFIVGIVMVGLPAVIGLRGLLAVTFAIGIPVFLLGLWAVVRRLAGLSEFVRVEEDSVAYVNPVRRSRSVFLKMGDIDAASLEEKKFGPSGKKSEMCATVKLKDGRKLTLTERFLPVETLGEMVDLIQKRLSVLSTTPEESTSPKKSTTLEESTSPEESATPEESAEESAPRAEEGE